MKKIILLTIILLTTGVACSNSLSLQRTIETGTDYSSSAKIIRQPLIEEPTNPSYDFCEENGNELIIRFDSVSNGSQAYCRFPDTTECLAETYKTGECGPNNGSQIYQAENETEIYENCTQIYEPVCTEGNITYTNDCMAKIQKATIIKKGACPTINNSGTPTISSDTPSTNIDPKKEPTETTGNTTPDWIQTVTDMISAQAVSNPKAYIDRCVYGGKTMYYQSSGCPDCQITLSSANGNILCYPNNDFKEICNSYLPLNSRQTYCQRLWTDKR